MRAIIHTNVLFEKVTVGVHIRASIPGSNSPGEGLGMKKREEKKGGHGHSKAPSDKPQVPDGKHLNDFEPQLYRQSFQCAVGFCSIRGQKEGKHGPVDLFA